MVLGGFRSFNVLVTTEFKSLTSHTSQAFSRLSFCNCKRCVCNYINWDDLLHSIAACIMGFFLYNNNFLI